MSTIPQNSELLKNLFHLIAEQRGIGGPQRVYERLELLVLAELFTFGRHTITQMLMSLGLNAQDWSGRSAWVYSLLLLAGYRTFGLARAPDVPTRWWRGSGRWSFATLLRAFRAALWGQPHFRPIFSTTPHDWVRRQAYWTALKNSLYAASRS